MSTSFQFENNYFAEMCSGSEAGSYLRLIDFVYHSTLGLRVIKKKKKYLLSAEASRRLPEPRQLLQTTRGTVISTYA